VDGLTLGTNTTVRIREPPDFFEELTITPAVGRSPRTGGRHTVAANDTAERSAIL
jgi:hypothetical protein